LTPTLLSLIRTAERSLRKLFPTATLISVTFIFDSHESGHQELEWEVYIARPGRPAILEKGSQLFDAVAAAMKAGSRGASKLTLSHISDN